jgi:hypothetical protein
MIKAMSTHRDGHHLLVFGLSEVNLQKLRQGQPIRIKLADMQAGNDEILIFYGTTEESAIELLRNAGVILPPREEWKGFTE